MKNYLKNRGNEKRNVQFTIQIKLGKMPITMLLYAKKEKRMTIHLWVYV